MKNSKRLFIYQQFQPETSVKKQKNKISVLKNQRIKVLILSYLCFSIVYEE
ncbi:unnamed protein product [Paramecium sonneborni]|uniref:Uncharacterized protein n=1 Tax=Paramecium sonneborni TaxID=65129 RepID=A0A8S1RTJ5_9CILI|nr:unnamed protein product [Paramecium sonneborni]